VRELGQHGDRGARRGDHDREPESKVLSSLAGLGVALLAIVGSLSAQQTSPVDDVLDRMFSDVNDFRYADAVRRGEEAAAITRAMSRTQQVRYRGLMAAAYYPEESTFQRPEAALRELDALIRLVPDAQLPQELFWRGLDSLLSVSRSRKRITPVLTAINLSTHSLSISVFVIVGFL
jgi:hypothetical protein